MSVINPVVPTYAARVPYITAAEYLAAPTGVDLSALVIMGTQQQQEDALVQVIARASSVIDTFCRKVLAATVDTQAGRYRLRNGIMRVPLDNTPIVEVLSIQVGTQPSNLTALSDLSNVWIDRKTVSVPVFPSPLSQAPWVSTSPSSGWESTDRVFSVISYVNGYPNCLLSASVTAGSSSMTVNNATGIVPGLTVTVYDSGVSEQVVVSSVIGNVVTIVGTFENAHATGVAVSALPPAVKQAAILITSGLIKTRGDDAFLMPEGGGQESGVAAIAGHAGEDFDLAEGLLVPYGRVQ